MPDGILFGEIDSRVGFETEGPVNEWVFFEALADTTEVSIGILVCHELTGIWSGSLDNTKDYNTEHEHDKDDDEDDIGWSSGS